jgi:hypothetical protein
VSGQSLGYFFNQWFYGQGYPSFTVKWKDSSNHKLYFTVTQITSMPSSVNFFRVLLPIQLNNGKKTKTIALNCIKNSQAFVVDEPGFVVKAIAIDPDTYLISKNNSAVNQQSLQAINIAEATAKITVSPNPVINTASVSLENMRGKIQLQLFNNAGIIVWNNQINVEEGSARIQIPFSSFANGIYKLLATEENGIQHSITIVK